MPTTAELLAALPADADDDHEASHPLASADLEQMFAKLGDRPVPTGKLRRLFSIG